MADNVLLFKPTYRDIKNSSKIFFACHPNDFKIYFDDISDQILEKASDNNISAVFSYINPDLKISFDDIKEYLNKMQLLVIPITWDLLLKPNMVIDSLLPFALEKHIPILPLMQDPYLTSEYAKHFGNIQFLCDDKNDKTAIPYEIKLNDFIKDTLVGDELRRRVQAAFDAYIFLSYRKKDRKQAQEIMHLIHQNEFCRDIAIWYDEFLTPGEDFNKSIQEAIKKSDLFAMVITPNIVEPGNYIIKHEYPAADTANKTILPLESTKTDKEELSKYYKNIPECTDIHNSPALSSALLRNLKITATEERDDSPEHNYLIGLAYLMGIDVETNHERGIELIKKAAEADLPEAVARMATIYRTGLGCDINYNQYEYWTDRLISLYKNLYPEYDSDGWLRLIHSLYNKMLLYSSTNNILKAKSCAEEAIFYASEVQREKDVYYVSYIIAFSHFILAGIDQQLTAKNSKETDDELILMNKTFRAGLERLHLAEKVMDEYLKRHPQDNLSMLKTLTYTQLFSSYSALRDYSNAKIYHQKLLSIAIEKNEHTLVDELKFGWLLFEKSFKLDFKNERKVKAYCYSVIKYFNQKELNKETALSILQFGFQLKMFAETLLNCDKLSRKDITLIKTYIEMCLSAFKAVPKKHTTNYLLFTFGEILLFATSFEDKLKRKSEKYRYWQEYLKITELILSRYDTVENKQKLREALHVLSFLAMSLKDRKAGYDYGLRNYKLCFEIVKLLPNDAKAHIECANSISFLAHYYFSENDIEKGLKYANSACEIAISVYQMFKDNKDAILNLAKQKHEYASLLCGAEKYDLALKNCNEADSLLLKLIEINKQDKSRYTVDFRLQVFDVLYDNIRLQGDIYLEIDNFEAAEKQYLYFLKMVDEKEKTTDVKKILERLAAVYIKTEDYQKAQDTFKKLIILDPKNTKALHNYKIVKQLLKQNTQ